MADLKIVGIRPRPAGLKSLDQENIKLTPLVALSLQSKGFFLTTRGLFSDQGDVLVSTDEGVVYTLRYGGPVFAEGDELTKGDADDAEKKKAEGGKKDAAKRPGGTQESRYLDGDGRLRPGGDLQARIDGAETGDVKPTGPVNLPDNVLGPDPKDPKYLADQKAAEEKVVREKTDYEKKIVDGKKKVEELADRFGAWYYVTPGDSFRSINLDRTDLIQPKQPPGAPASPPAGFHPWQPAPRVLRRAGSGLDRGQGVLMAPLV